MQVTITEHNDWEGETFGYILDLEPILIDKILKGLQEEIEEGVIEVSVDTNYTQEQVDTINKHSSNTYMDRLNFYSLAVNDVEDWYYDVFYKGVGLKKK